MVDLKKIENKNDFIKFKDKCISDLNKYIDNLKSANYKQAVNLTYWLNSYSNYLKQEKTFNSIYRPVYKFGSVVEINLGFRLGSEFGGQHYGIVINKKDKKANPNLTIIPMRSMKENIRYTEVAIGSEFYNLAKNKVELLANEKAEMENNFIEKIKELEENLSNSDFENNKKYYESELKELISQKNSINSNIEDLKSCLNRISKLKDGSIALPNQVLTISKMRVKDPIKTRDTLYGIVLSDSTMEKIKKGFDRIYF